MNLFCKLFGHTWWPETHAPEPRWNTTKDGHVLVSTSADEGIRHSEICKRCGEVRNLGARGHDGDRPESADEAAEGAAGSDEEEERESA